MDHKASRDPDPLSLLVLASTVPFAHWAPATLALLGLRLTPASACVCPHALPPCIRASLPGRLQVSAPGSPCHQAFCTEAAPPLLYHSTALFALDTLPQGLPSVSSNQAASSAGTRPAWFTALPPARRCSITHFGCVECIVTRGQGVPWRPRQEDRKGPSGLTDSPQLPAHFPTFSSP